jgi:hypothetical protein
MRIGLVVDGQSEVDALPSLLRRIDPQPEMFVVVNAGFHPEATSRRIAQGVVATYGILSGRRVDMLVVLLDLETRPDCPGKRAAMIRSEIVSRLPVPSVSVEVVIKVRSLENWLIADPDCLRELRALFPRAAQMARAVRIGTADHLDALALLQRASAPGRAYDKRRGAAAICSHLDTGRAAVNSRSFRRFLRVLGDRRYAAQSRLPNPGD